MTKQEFETYGFSVNTRILTDDEWFDVISVDFEDHTVLCKNLSHWVYYEDIDEIIEGK